MLYVSSSKNKLSNGWARVRIDLHLKFGLPLLLTLPTLVSPLIFSACLSPASVNGSTFGTYHLAFQAPFDQVQIYNSDNDVKPIPVAVMTSGNLVVTSGNTYTVTLSSSQDSQCNSYCGGVGNSATTVKGVVAIDPSSGGTDTQSKSASCIDGAKLVYIKASAPGLTSACSPAVNFLVADSHNNLNLAVPIEMLDAPASVSATSGTTTFNRSQTPLNTMNYGGSTVSYYFEVSGSLTSSTGGTFSLVNASNAVQASINFSAPFSGTARSNSFAPTNNADTYSVKITNGSTTGTATASAARIIIVQNSTSYTQTYIPLTSGLYNGTSTTDASADSVASTSASTWTSVGASGTIWTYQNSGNFASSYSSLSTGSAWSLDVVLSSSSNLGTCQAGLVSTAAPTTLISGTSTTGVSSTTPTTQASYFSGLTPGASYQLAIQSSGGYTCYVYRAGLRVAYNNMNNAEIYYRVLANSMSSLANGKQITQAINIDPNLFSNPSVYFEVTGLTSATPVLSLADCGASSTSNTLLSCTNLIANELTGLTNTLGTYRTTGPLSISSYSDDYVFSLISQSATISGAFAVITIHN